MKINQKGLDLIKSFEGLELEAYLCPAGVWTIGYGRTTDVQPGDKITAEQAEKWLLEEIKNCERYVDFLVAVPITFNQKWALISFVYNVGSMAFRKSTLLKLLNKRDYAGAVNEFSKWNKTDGQVLLGLTKRRTEEAALFNTPDDV